MLWQNRQTFDLTLPSRHCSRHHSRYWETQHGRAHCCLCRHCFRRVSRDLVGTPSQIPRFDPPQQRPSHCHIPISDLARGDCRHSDLFPHPGDTFNCPGAVCVTNPGFFFVGIEQLLLQREDEGVGGGKNFPLSPHVYAPHLLL